MIQIEKFSPHCREIVRLNPDIVIDILEKQFQKVA